MFNLNSISQVTTIDFETAGAGYTPSTTAGTIFTDVFNRINDDLPSCTNESGFYWGVEDLPVVDPSIDIDQIDVTGSTSFTFSIDMVAHHFNDWDDSDELLITYSVDGGGYQNLMWVQNAGATFNQLPSLDTDFDGTGDCGAGTLPALTTGTSGCTTASSDFQTFVTGSIALAANSTLDIRLQFNGLDATDEGIYIDNIIITESGGAATCNISSSGVANIACNNDGTIPDATDDYITFDLNPTGSTLGATYSVSASVGSITPNTGISYGSATTFTLDPGTAGGGTDIDITITDVDDGTCTFVQTITDPGSCSSNDCGSETFDLSNATGSYSDNSYVGDNGVTWTYTESRDESTYGITGNGLMLRNTTSALTSSSVAGGIGSFTCNLRKAFTGAGNRQVELFVNGVSQGTSIAWDNTAVQTFTVNNINISGNVVIEIRNITGNQVIIDDISWTCFSCPSPVNVTALAATSECNSVDVSWTVPSCAEEVLVVARENATVAAGLPTGDGTAYTANSVFGSGTALLSGRVVYKGVGSAVNITNMTGTAHFKVFSRVGTTWSAGVSTSIAVNTTIPNATSLNAIDACGDISIGWVDPICFDEVLVVVRDGSAVTATPSGDGTAYTANATFGSGTDLGASQFTIFKGLGNAVTMTGLTLGNTYHIEVFTRKGTSWSSGVSTSFTTTAGSVSGPTTFYPGELIFVGYDCFVTSGTDKWSVLTMVDIGPGTEFIIANALYDWNAAPGVLSNKWYGCFTNFTGVPEFMEITYNGCADIAQGSIICVETSTGGAINSIKVNGVDATTDFTFVGDAGNMNSGGSGDAMWLMQGTLDNSGLTEPDGPDADALDDFYATFDGTVLGAIQTYGDFQDPALAGNIGGTRISRWHPQVECLYINAGVAGSQFYGEYTGVRSGDYFNLLSNITDVATNWTLGNNTANIDDIPTSCTDVFTITGLLGRAGRWRGTVSTDWFDCRNWENFSVPDETVHVRITGAAVRDCDISFTSPKAQYFGNVGDCDSLSLLSRKLTIDEIGDSLNVYSHLNLNFTGHLDMNDDNGGTLEDGSIFLRGGWTNSTPTTTFDYGDGIIYFIGDTDQEITTSGFRQDFANVVVNKGLGEVVLNNNIGIDRYLDLFNRNIETGSNFAIILNSIGDEISSFSENSFINGNLRRNYTAGNNYFFPVGYSNTNTDYHLASIMNTSLTGVTYINGKVENLAEAGNNIDSRIPMALIETGVGRLNNIHSEAIWTFTPNAAPSGGTYGVQLYEMNIAGLTDDLFVPVKRDAASTDYVDWDNFDATTNIMPAGGPGRITNAGFGYSQRVGYTDFSHHAISDVTTVLSVKEIELSVNYSNSSISINWTPTFEGNNEGNFELLRSYNNIDFDVINKEKFSAEKNSYNFVDNKMNKSKAYYKVRYVSSTEKVYSNTDMVTISENLVFSLFPNPNEGNFRLSLNSKNGELVTYLIFDALGKQVYSNTIFVEGSVIKQIELDNINSGIYHLVIQSSSIKESVKLVIK